MVSLFLKDPYSWPSLCLIIGERLGDRGGALCCVPPPTHTDFLLLLFLPPSQWPMSSPWRP